MKPFPILSLLLLVSFALRLPGQSTQALHPLLGLEIDFEERKRYKFNRIVKLDFPNWHKLQYQKTPSGIHQFISVDNPALPPTVVDKEEMAELIKAIEKQSLQIINQLSRLEKILKEKDEVRVKLLMNDGQVAIIKAKGMENGILILEEKEVVELFLPVEHIEALWIEGLDEVDWEEQEGKSFFQNLYFLNYSGLPLKKGEIQYQNVTFVSHFFHMGINKHLNASFGIDLLSTLFSLDAREFLNLMNFSMMAQTHVSEHIHLGMEVRIISFGFQSGFLAMGGLGTYSGKKGSLTLRAFSVLNPNMEELPPSQGVGIGFSRRLGKHLAIISDNLSFYNQKEDVFDGENNFRQNLYLFPSVGARFMYQRLAVDIGLSASIALFKNIRTDRFGAEFSSRSSNMVATPFLSLTYMISRGN